MCTNIKNQPMLKINDMIPHLKNKNIQFKECNEKDVKKAKKIEIIVQNLHKMSNFKKIKTITMEYKTLKS